MFQGVRWGRPDWEIGVEKDNKDETLVKPE